MPINHQVVNENSKKAVEGLEPASVWKHFYELSRIPRPSKKEQAVVEWVKSYSKEHGYELKIDDVLNCSINVPATKGYEKATPIVIQGHIDMVCEKEPTTDHDFDKDPIELIRDGDWVTANETTLGADNGIGVAIGMSVVLDKELNHGPIQLLLTTDEEMGMTGAMELKKGFVEGKSILLNLDSEEDGAYYVGCAGGADSEIALPIELVDAPEGFKPYTIRVGGLSGGHSGLEVILNRGNANQIVSQFLEHIGKTYPFHLGYIQGGSKRNAIPRDSYVVVLLKEDDAKAIQKELETFDYASHFDYQQYESPKITLNEGSNNVDMTKVFSQETTTKALSIILGTHSGVVTMSQEIENMVETSTTLSVVLTSENRDQVLICSLARSSNKTALAQITRQTRAIGELAGAKARTFGEYPGWQPNANSQVLKVAKDVYRQINNGEDAEIKSIHAGLECGLLLDIYPDMDPISFGPTITGAHSPSERVRIRDVGISYELTKAIISRIAEDTK